MDPTLNNNFMEPAPTAPTQAVPSVPSPAASSPVLGSPEAALTFDTVDDGCICGRIRGGMWVADEGGCVTLPRGATREDELLLRRLVAEHFSRVAAERAAASSAEVERITTSAPAVELRRPKGRSKDEKPVPVVAPAPAKQAKTAGK